MRADDIFVGFFKIRFEISGKEKVKSYPQLAYAINPDTFEIIISNSGHPTIMRGRDKRDFEGGWIFLAQKKITFNSGFLGEMRGDREVVREAISMALGADLRTVG